MANKGTRWYNSPRWEVANVAILTLFAITNGDKVIRILMTVTAVVGAFDLGRKSAKRSDRP
jgi:hypothetical protein